MNPTLILSATHGNEAFSIPVVEKLKSKFSFDWLISNPKALKQGTRFFQADLNRSAPGDSQSKIYELRRAAELIKLSANYQQTIDLHGTIANTGIFIILSDPNWQNIELAKKFDVPNVVLWPSLQPKGPITQFAKGLELECGPKNTRFTAKELQRILERFLAGKPRRVNQTFYIVTGSLKTPIKRKMKDFVSTSYKGATFTPLLADQYPGIKCYCMQKLESPLDFNTTNKTL